MEEKMVKIVFHFESDITDITVETMWAIEVDANKGLYKIDNIPFYVPLVASDDIVFAEYDDDEQRLVYKYTVEPSGNSIITVFTVDEKTDIQNIRDVFKQLGCESEGLTKRLFTLEIPFDTRYAPVRKKLIELEESDVIYYAERCLSAKHGSEY